IAKSHSVSVALIATAVPVASLFVLTLAVKLAVGGGGSTWSGRILLLATAAALCTAAFIYFQPITTLALPIGLTITAAWLPHAILLGRAGLAADFTEIVAAPRRPVPDLPRWRLVLFAVLALLAPLDIALDFARAGRSGPQVIAVLVPPIIATIILLLLVARLA